MIWNDIVFESEHSGVNLAEAISIAFGYSPTEVTICDDYDSVPEPSARTITGLVSSRDRGFRQTVSLYVYDGSAADLANNAVVQRMVDQLNDRCLLPSESENPFEMTLFAPNKNPERAFLKPKPMEDEEIYILDE